MAATVIDLDDSEPFEESLWIGQGKVYDNDTIPANVRRTQQPFYTYRFDIIRHSLFLCALAENATTTKSGLKVSQTDLETFRLLTSNLSVVKAVIKSLIGRGKVITQVVLTRRSSQTEFSLYCFVI